MNTIGSTHQMGVLGIRRGTQQIERAALEVARSAPRKGFAEPLVGMKEGKLQAQASVKALQAANTVMGSLLDVKA